MNSRSNNPRAASPAPPTSGRGRGRPRIDDKRRRVLDAALRVFAARGYHGTTVPEVAAAAEVATGTLYHYFEDKQALVNEVYRDAKANLKSALLDGLEAPDIDKPGALHAWFTSVWHRFGTFAREQPDAFRFLEMQDHVDYLDAESRKLERATLGPLFLVARQVHTRADVVMALLWGGFIGLIKAQRLGYLALDEAGLAEAGEAMWRLLEPEARRMFEGRGKSR